MAALNDIRWDHLEQVLIRYGQHFVQQARTNLGMNNSYASGKLGDTMKPHVEIEGDKFAVYVEIQTYWDYVEKGRRPGKFPPVNRIKEWIKVKPIRPYKDKRGKLPTTDQLAFLIGRKIKTKGIPARPFFKPAQEETESFFKGAIDNAILYDIETYINEKVRTEYYKQLMGII